MGIDITAHWKGQTKRQQRQQDDAIFLTTQGRVGYLREAYHGGPYVTRYLVREAFEAENSEAPIASAELAKRLPIAVLMAFYRHERVYDGKHRIGPKRLEADADVIFETVSNLFAPGGEIDRMKTGEEGKAFARTLDVASIHACNEAIAAGMLPSFALSFVDFVNLCAEKEQQCGEPCLIRACY